MARHPVCVCGNEFENQQLKSSIHSQWICSIVVVVCIFIWNLCNGQRTTSTFLPFTSTDIFIYTEIYIEYDDGMWMSRFLLLNKIRIFFHIIYFMQHICIHSFCYRRIWQCQSSAAACFSRISSATSICPSVVWVSAHMSALRSQRMSRMCVNTQICRARSTKFNLNDMRIIIIIIITAMSQIQDNRRMRHSFPIPCHHVAIEWMTMSIYIHIFYRNNNNNDSSNVNNNNFQYILPECGIIIHVDQSDALFSLNCCQKHNSKKKRVKFVILFPVVDVA